MKLMSLALILLAMLAAACDKPAGNAQPPPTSSPPPAVNSTLVGLPTRAQPKLPTLKLWLGAEELIAELALTAQQQLTGMMFRTNMAENAGMLFPLPQTGHASFWMMNCPLPLSTAYISPDGTILEIHDFIPFNTNSVVSASDQVRFVLEVNQGWFKRHNVREGMVVRTEQGSLMATFFGKR